ncbi:cold-regulated protein 27-like isoform X2 [Populus alba x Populus x berolinensis]|uniref:Cold-regulated protein 27-like isoform X2 n=1 Tax=Populus alba x Populus x berolinensis TaxID=444605 RepID=A0AAD6LVI1_9ROSI|nr:cold-regulated protein 27-like isoform X2 [Populus alba x Populus x berolinensis]
MVFMDGYRGSESRTSSETSELTGYESGELAQQDSPVIASMASEWTDEKHNLYLKSMEASFVNQLHNSMDLLGWRSRKEGSVPNLSREVNCRTCTPSGEFKVLRRGNWQKINFRRPESQISSAKESRGFLTSPWIQHFTSARKPEDVASPPLQECANQSRATISNGKKAMLCCPAISSKHNHLSNSFSCHHDLVDSNTVSSLSFSHVTLGCTVKSVTQAQNNAVLICRVEGYTYVKDKETGRTKLFPVCRRF